MRNAARSQTGDSRRRSRAPLRAGISLIEVAVVVGIIGLLASLIVPAVQAAREAARRTGCVSNFRQIMIAQHNYVDSYRVFLGNNRGRFTSRLLPYLGELPDAERYSVYACPSDNLATGEDSYKLRYSYWGNNGLLGASASGDGFLADSTRSLLGPEDITDGLSATAAVSERLAQPEWYGQLVDWRNFPELWIRRLRLTQTFHADPAAIADECTHRAGVPMASWPTISYYTHIMTPNGNSCTNGRPFQFGKPYACTATSMHPQGVNVAIGDGAVRFVSNAVDRTIWWAAGTRSGNETQSLR